MTTSEHRSTAEGQSAAKVAASSSFYTALRILPRAEREAMFQVYAFCRAVDDIADEGGSTPERLAGLERWRHEINELYHRHRAGLLVRPLAPAIAEFNLQRQDFLAVIDGMEMDVRRTITAPDWAELDLYCDRVASAVGRLSVRIFGVEEKAGLALSHHLGRALQLTNILRDLDEDAAMGRLYLPAEALDAAGIAEREPAKVLAQPALADVCATLVGRARQHFAEAERIMATQPRATVRSPRVMATVYGSILDRLEARGWAPPRARIRVPKLQVVWAVLRHGLM
jgi:phytoene synthase